jgi:hypothetical protein
MNTTTFNPGRHGFHFSNNDIQWKWWGPISGYTLCGGMVYAALDYYLNKLGVPANQTAPPVGDTQGLNTYIYERQKSAHINTLTRYGTTAHEGIDPEQVSWLNYYLGQLMPIPLFLYNLIGETAHHVLAIACTDDETPLIWVYDPNYPNVTSILDPVGSGYFERPSGQSWSGFFVDYGYAKVTPPLLNCEDQWRWCCQCQSLFYIGYGRMGYCPATGVEGGPRGPHVAMGSGNYALPLDTGNGEANWRWCCRCSGLYFGGTAGNAGVCPAPGGGNHLGKGRSYNMALGSGYGQGNWRWCRICQSMFFVGGGSLGICPAKNAALLSDFGHDCINSPEYFIPTK